MIARVGFGKLFVGCFDQEFPAVWHGVAGIDRQVHEHLLDLSWIGLDPAQPGAQYHGQFNILSNQPAQHLFHVGDHHIQIQDLRLKHLAAAEGQQLLRQGGGAVPGLANLLHRGAHRRVFREPAEHDLAVTGNDRDQIIEVMRNPAGQPADGLHLLGLGKLLLQQLTPGDVAHHHNTASIQSARISQWRTGHVEGLVQAHFFIVAPDGFSGLQKVTVRTSFRRFFFSVQRLTTGVPDQAGKGQSENLAGGPIGAQNAAVAFQNENGGSNGVKSKLPFFLPGKHLRLQMRCLIPLLLLVESAPDGRRQSRRITLQDVFRGSPFDIFHSSFVAQRSGHNDERDVLARPFQYLQSIQAGPTPDIVVAEDDVKTRLFQLLPQHFRGVHQLSRTGQAAAPQHSHIQGRIVRAVVDNQQTQRPQSLVRFLCIQSGCHIFAVPTGKKAPGGGAWFTTSQKSPNCFTTSRNCTKSTGFWM